MSEVPIDMIMSGCDDPTCDSRLGTPGAGDSYAARLAQHLQYLREQGWYVQADHGLTILCPRHAGGRIS